MKPKLIMFHSHICFFHIIHHSMWMCEIEELQQDDELVLGMVENDGFPGVIELAGPTPFNAALKIKKMAVVAFYLTCQQTFTYHLVHFCNTSAIHSPTYCVQIILDQFHISL